ncbi:hypothetical protein QVD17_11220 [Tagetes erecta]|uniref:FBD domain-containing protein n=1 Tax=Tagetes erecta TaxID=13708 RepID=A0AAD8KXQ5_TARER|nr:hypothetical protein QVD17_11220 [Tagetes erecta]
MEWVWFGHKYSVPFILLMIRSSPNLEKLQLEIDVEVSFDESFLGSFVPEDYSNIMLEHLNEMEIIDYSHQENEVAFVKLILANSPVLKEVRIFMWNEIPKRKKVNITKMLLSLPCASPVVKIIVTFALPFWLC